LELPPGGKHRLAGRVSRVSSCGNACLRTLFRQDRAKVPRRFFRDVSREVDQETGTLT